MDLFLNSSAPQTKTLLFQQELFIGMSYDSSIAHFHTFEIAPETGLRGNGALHFRYCAVLPRRLSYNQFVTHPCDLLLLLRLSKILFPKTRNYLFG